MFLFVIFPAVREEAVGTLILDPDITSVRELFLSNLAATIYCLLLAAIPAVEEIANFLAIHVRHIIPPLLIVPVLCWF